MVDLVEMAFTQNACNLLSTKFHGLLAGHLGKPSAVQILNAVQELIHKGDAAGARFLAAFLEVTTPGARLIPRIQDFSSARRYFYVLQSDSRPTSPQQGEWLRRAEVVSSQTQELLDVLGRDPAFDETHPGKETPWPAWRRCFLTFLEDIVAGRDLTQDARLLMAELIRLETDAWQERTSNLAGTVNPYNTVAVQRVLPILSTTDSQVQDLRQLIHWVEDGNDRAAFTNQVSSALEVMDDRDHNRLRKLIKDEPSLATLAALSAGLYSNPTETMKMAQGAASLMALTHQLVLAEVRKDELGLLGCIQIIQEFRDGDKLVLPLGDDLGGIVKAILRDPAREKGPSLWPLDGLKILGDQLQVDLSSREVPDRWENFLPTAKSAHVRGVAAPLAEGEVAAEEQDTEEEQSEDLSTAAIKHLVMSNIMSTSVILGFLRNPKVISIPGLVAEVATRTRNPQIIETIATDRALYTGFANRDVARVCLMSPCNTSVKTLRKFIHVKFVNKVDLKRMSQDKAGIRREVIREIVKYLEVLA